MFPIFLWESNVLEQILELIICSYKCPLAKNITDPLMPLPTAIMKHTPNMLIMSLEKRADRNKIITLVQLHKIRYKLNKKCYLQGIGV
jgi:hypothetical protein